MKLYDTIYLGDRAHVTYAIGVNRQQYVQLVTRRGNQAWGITELSYEDWEALLAHFGGHTNRLDTSEMTHKPNFRSEEMTQDGTQT